MPPATAAEWGFNMNQVGRNDKCPCGSGKKYKHCCIGKRLNKDNKPIFTGYGDEREIVKNLNGGKKLIYLTSYEILYDQNEEILSKDEFNGIMDKIIVDDRFKISPIKDDNFEILYCSQDCQMLSKDYSILKEASLNIMEMELDRHIFTLDEYKEKVNQLHNFLSQYEWSSLDIKAIVSFLQGIDISTCLEDFWSDEIKDLK